MDTAAPPPLPMYRPRAIRGTIMDAQVNTGPLAPHVILWGGNDGGKNRVTRVLELALTAAVDDVMGRGTAGPKGDPVRLIADLADLANPDGSILATVDLERPGDEAALCATWTLRSKAGGHSATWELPPVLRLLKDRGNTEAAWWVMPTRTVYQWISSGPELARQHFLPYIVPPAEIREALDTPEGTVPEGADPGSFPTLRKRTASLLPSSPLTTADDILDVIQVLKGDVDALSTLVEQKTAVLDERRRAIRSPRVAPEVIATLTGALSAARETQRHQNVVTAAGPMLTEYWGLAGALPAQAAHIENARTAALAYVAGSRPFLNPDASVQQASAQGVLNALNIGVQATAALQVHQSDLQWMWAGLQTQPRCACCGGIPDATVLPYVANVAQGMIQPSQAALAAHAQWLSLGAQWTAAQTQIEQWTAMYKANLARHAALERDLRLLLDIPQGPLPAAVQVEEVAGLAATLTDLTTRVDAANAANALWTEVAAIEENVTSETERLTRIQGVLQNLSGMIEALLVRCVKDFETAVSRYLPEGTEAAIRLSDDPGKGTKVRRMFRLTFRRGGREESPCGGGMTALVLAVTAVVLDRFPGKINGTVLTLPDDRGWSPDGLERYLTPLSACPYPIFIVCNVEPPAALADLGWQILHVNEVTRLGAVAGVAQTAPAPTTKAPRKPRASRTTTVADAAAAPSPAPVTPVTTNQPAETPAPQGSGMAAFAAALVDKLVFATPDAPVAATASTAPTAAAPQAMPTTPPSTSPADAFRQSEEDRILGDRGWTASQIGYLRKKPDQLARALATDDIRPLSVGGQWLVTTAGQLTLVPPAPAPN